MRRLRGRTMGTTGRTSVTILFLKLPSGFRSRKCSEGRVGLPSYRGRLMRGILRMRGRMIIILRGNSTIIVP